MARKSKYVRQLEAKFTKAKTNRGMQFIQTEQRDRPTGFGSIKKDDLGNEYCAQRVSGKQKTKGVSKAPTGYKSINQIAA